jgi:Flp pilus assembly protein TadG
MTVEFALVLPILMALMFGMIDVGRFIAARVAMAQAAAAGARAACLSSTTTQAPVDAAVQNAALALSGITVSGIACANPAGCAPVWPKPTGAIVAVTVRYNFIAGYFMSFRRSMTNTSRVVC